MWILACLAPEWYVGMHFLCPETPRPNKATRRLIEKNLFFRVHVVFGLVISGFEVVKKIEGLKTDSASRPYADVRVVDCGQLITKSANDGSFTAWLSLSFSCPNPSFGADFVAFVRKCGIFLPRAFVRLSSPDFLLNEGRSVGHFGFQLWSAHQILSALLSLPAV